ncbi:alpha/beta fold hydrolase [Streptomyces sp. ITFR-6]|uniref:alpha/beta hydrolase family protein n=1 Tax=Streptomyces sp. ITFR-6 TaxID=3075197 RepID=UPI0028893A18|nr:alpha/beta fold hydrolase [Streptomyces sp. ITFR-6]WNI30971.1 alpha/beta fold hydrolase [Streptomyces sp. ITFR-6]
MSAARWEVPLPAEGGDGPQRIVAQVTESARAPRAVVLIWPAMAVQASYYAPFCADLAALDIASVAADLRGQGESRPRVDRGSSHGYNELASRDWPRMVAAVRERFGEGVPLYLLGHSIGGQVSVLYAAREPKGVDGLIFVAAGSVDFRGFPGMGGLRVLLSTQLAAVIARLWGYFPGDRLGFAGRQPARLIRDWARIARTGRFEPSGAEIAYAERLRSVRLPVLAVSVSGDSLAPPATVDRLCATLPSATVERWHFEPSRGVRVDHVRWARRGAPIAERIRAWADGL